MADTVIAPPPVENPAGRRKARRKERKAKGNGRAGAFRAPKLRDLLFKDLRPSELPANFRTDLKQLYRFYLDEERRAQLAAMGRIRRAFKVVGWTLKSLLTKLSPGRRLALFVSLVMVFLGQVELPLRDGSFTADLRVWAYFIVLLVLMLELKAGSAGLRFLNAGHNPPLLQRARTTESLMASAIPLGMMAGTTYAEGDLLLEPGDFLVVYSDGLTEASDSRDEEFG